MSKVEQKHLFVYRFTELLLETKHEKQSECQIFNILNILWKVHIVEYYTTINMLSKAIDDIWKVHGKAVKIGCKIMCKQHDSNIVSTWFHSSMSVCVCMPGKSIGIIISIS